jgi:DNA-binding response OmpR family regulator
LNFNEIRVRTDENQVFVNDRRLNLTRKEYDLLLFFLANKERIITKELIVEHSIVKVENNNHKKNLYYTVNGEMLINT